MDTLRLGALMTGLGPLLLAQGRAVRRRTPLLAPCPDVRETVPGQGPALRLGLVGDSIIAGVGVQNQREGFSGRLAHHLAELTGRPVEWCTRGCNGARARDLKHLELPEDFQPELVVVSVGVNDVLNLTSRNAFRRRLGGLAHRYSVPLVLAGIPDFNSFPSLPRPLKDTLAWRGRTLEAAVPPPWRVFRFERQLRRDEFSADDFHPGALGCDAWARELAAQLA